MPMYEKSLKINVSFFFKFQFQQDQQFGRPDHIYPSYLCVLTCFEVILLLTPDSD